MSAPSPFTRLIRLMARLRAPNGCPWDRQQSHRSLRPYLLEEAHEVLEAIDAGKPDKLRDELGDLLFQVVFHAQVASEAGRFDIDDVVRGSLDKMRRRHPHIFGKVRCRNAGEVLENWEEIKRRERRGSGESLLAGVPRSLPALLRAHRVQSKAARVGFTWARIDEAMSKVHEEVAELEAALLARRTREIAEELGDVFFALVNLARFAGSNPEDALHRAVTKFIRRFALVEKAARRQRRPLADFDVAELEALWGRAKQKGKVRRATAARPARGTPRSRRKTPAESTGPARPARSRRGRPRRGARRP